MLPHDYGDETHLSIEIEPELRQLVEAAAAERRVTVKAYVAAVLREALETPLPERAPSQSADWTRLSVPSFARDWESDADAVYDDLA
jgi:hypothetical protein